MMRRILIRAGLRQACFGVLVVVLSLPLLWAFHDRAGLSAPRTFDVLLVGAGVMVSFAGAGALGGALYELARGTRFERRKSAGWIAALGGLLFGSLICLAIASFYGEGILGDVAEQGIHMAWNRRAELQQKTRETMLASGKELAGEHVSRLPVLMLLLWALPVPALGAALEYRLAGRR